MQSEKWSSGNSKNYKQTRHPSLESICLNSERDVRDKEDSR
jgi:hypothetical protein